MSTDTAPDFALDALDTLPGSEAGVAMTVRDLDGRPMTDARGTTVTIRVLGPDSAVYRRLMREQVARRMARGNEQPDAQALQEEAEGDAIAVMAACTVGWDGINDRKGEPIPCSRDNAASLYRRYPAIREQVDGFIFHRKNFLPVSSKA